MKSTCKVKKKPLKALNLSILLTVPHLDTFDGAQIKNEIIFVDTK